MLTANLHGSRSRDWLHRLIVALCMLALACSQETVATPSYGSIKLTLATSGGDPDLDGYEIDVDGRVSAQLREVSAVESLWTPSGPHMLEIRGVASNCTVVGPNPRPVTVVEGQIIPVSIEVACVATGITITTRTEGPYSPGVLRVVVDSQPSVSVPANGARIISRLTSGTHAIALLAPAHCTVAGGDRITVDVVAATITGVAFTVTCVPPTRRERIAYVTEDVEFGTTTRWIELVDVDGSNVERLEHGDAPAWSPDGKELAYSDVRCDLDPWYYAPYCSGGLLIEDPEVGDIRRPANGEFAFSPAWSPARNELVIGYSDGRLMLLDLATFVTTPISIEGLISMKQAAWSPDGARIAFVCGWPQPIATDLCVVSRNGSGLVRLTNDADRESRPAWSPDGTRIAFAKSAPADGALPDIALLDLGASNVAMLGRGWDPAWSPDGSKLVFADVDGLYVMNADGSNRRRLTTGLHHAPAWRPR